MSAAPAPRERTIALPGRAVSFRVQSAGQGPDLVWLHSFHDRAAWPPLLDRLAERFTVHAPSHPGVRGSEGVEALDDVVDLALAYDELLEAMGIPAAALVGHFFGAMVAAEVAALCPRRARRLCLVSPLGLWLAGKPVADVVILPQRELHPLLWRDPESAPARAWATLPATEAENVTAQIEQVQRLAAMGRFVWPIPDKGLKRRAHRIAAPTLLLWGDADRVNPAVYADAFQALLPGARLSRLAGGHMLHLEAPDAVGRAVAEFCG